MRILPVGLEAVAHPFYGVVPAAERMGGPHGPPDSLQLARRRHLLAWMVATRLLDLLCEPLRHCPWRLRIISSIFFLTASRLNEAGSCIGGYLIAVFARSATFCWTITNRQNSRAKKSFP